MKRNIENRTILIILILILIILVGYFMIINLPSGKNYYSVEEVLLNKEKYLNNEIIIRGYYDSNLIAIVSTMSEVLGKSYLKLDYTGVVNATDILRNGVKFDFTGTLQVIENISSPEKIIVFKVNKIEIV